MLRAVLAVPIRVTPIVESGRRGFRFEGQLAVDRVISGSGISDSRDGQFPLRLIREFRMSSPKPRHAGCRRRRRPGLLGLTRENPRAGDAMPEADDPAQASSEAARAPVAVP